MKLRYLIPSFIALVAMFAGCSDDDDPTYLDEVKVSSSYIGLPQNGGSQTITITARDNWSFDDGSIPEWLTVSPKSGSAGEGTVTFSVAASEARRNCEVLLNCGGRTQRINVLQHVEEKEPAMMNVAEAVALIKSGKAPASAVYVKGIVCRIQEISPAYGNATYYISDDGTFGADNWLQIYRGKWINNANFTTGDEFGVGDEMVIKGVLIDYNGTPETQQGACEVVSINKSLIKVETLTIGGEEAKELPVEGGEIVATLACKGSGVAVEIPASAQSWLGVVSTTVGENPTVTFRAQPNTGGDRNTTVTFKTTDGKKDYSAQATISQKGAILEVTVDNFLKAAVDDTQYRLTGVITSLYDSDKQGKSFYIRDYSGEVLIYRAEGFIEAGAKVGDVVTLVGKRSAYNDNPQMGGGQYESHISVTEVTIAEFLTKPDDKNVYYKVTGMVSDLLSQEKDGSRKENDYGNLHITDGTNELYVYGCYPGWGATGDFRKNCLADKGIEVGDKLTVIGVKATFNDAPQVSNGIYFSHVKANEE